MISMDGPCVEILFLPLEAPPSHQSSYKDHIIQKSWGLRKGAKQNVPLCSCFRSKFNSLKDICQGQSTGPTGL